MNKATVVIGLSVLAAVSATVGGVIKWKKGRKSTPAVTSPAQNDSVDVEIKAATPKRSAVTIIEINDNAKHGRTPIMTDEVIGADDHECDMVTTIIIPPTAVITDDEEDHASIDKTNHSDNDDDGKPVFTIGEVAPITIGSKFANIASRMQTRNSAIESRKNKITNIKNLHEASKRRRQA